MTRENSEKSAILIIDDDEQIRVEMLEVYCNYGLETCLSNVDDAALPLYHDVGCWVRDATPVGGCGPHANLFPG